MEEACYSTSASKAVYLGKLAAAVRTALNSVTASSPTPCAAPAQVSTSPGVPAMVAGGAARGPQVGQPRHQGDGPSLISGESGSGSPGAVAVASLEDRMARLEREGAPLKETLQGLRELKEARWGLPVW